MTFCTEERREREITLSIPGEVETRRKIIIVGVKKKSKYYKVARKKLLSELLDLPLIMGARSNPFCKPIIVSNQLAKEMRSPAIQKVTFLGHPVDLNMIPKLGTFQND